MWRTFLLAALLVIGATAAAADGGRLIGRWSVCDGAPGAPTPRLTNCRPLTGRIDPQGRELWLRAPVRPRTAREDGPTALYIFGAASSEAWFNGVRLGANGAPGPTAVQERPGRYEAELPIPSALWRAAGGE